jgi:hypothetical protein
MKFTCKNCGDTFKPSRQILKEWDNGEIDTPDLCPDCIRELVFMGCPDLEYERYSDADPGL